MLKSKLFSSGQRIYHFVISKKLKIIVLSVLTKPPSSLKFAVTHDQLIKNTNESSPVYRIHYQDNKGAIYSCCFDQ